MVLHGLRRAVVALIDARGGEDDGHLTELSFRI